MKRFKYFFATITLITAVLCSALFCACNEKGQGNQKQQEMIEDIYFKKYGQKFVYDKYYGVFDSANAYFQSSDISVIKCIKVAENIFKYSYDWDIYIFKGSKVYKLEEAYQFGILSKESVSNLADTHKQYVKDKLGQSDDDFEIWYYSI